MSLGQRTQIWCNFWTRPLTWSRYFKKITASSVYIKISNKITLREIKTVYKCRLHPDSRKWVISGRQFVSENSVTLKWPRSWKDHIIFILTKAKKEFKRSNVKFRINLTGKLGLSFEFYSIQHIQTNGDLRNKNRQIKFSEIKKILICFSF